MRSRVILLVVAILLVAAFAALNWAEIVRPSPLLFGPVVMDAPLGLILLSLLGLAVVAFVLAAGTMRTHSLLESRHHYKELEAQRLLADKAEASRFTELRTHLDTSLREMRERDAMLTTELQRELRAQTEQSNRMFAARLNELEHRLESRFERMGLGTAGRPAMGVAPVRTDMVPPVRHDPVPPAAAVHRDPMQPAPVREHAMAEADLRAEQLRQREAELREQERMREVRHDEKAAAADKPEAGWRRWF